MLSRSVTKAELQINQLKHKQLPPQIDFAILQHDTLKPVHYVIKHEEIPPHQKHDSHPILADYGTDQFSIRINDKGNDIIVKLLQSFSFKSVTPFQTKFETPIKRTKKHFTNNLFYSMTRILLATMKIMYTQKFQNLKLLSRQIQHYKTIILLLKNQHLKHHNKSLLQSMYKLTLHLSHIVHKLYPSMILPSLNTKTLFKAFSYLMTTH